jgi:hypothetical protein
MLIAPPPTERALRVAQFWEPVAQPVEQLTFNQ